MKNGVIDFLRQGDEFSINLLTRWYKDPPDWDKSQAKVITSFLASCKKTTLGFSTKSDTNRAAQQRTLDLEDFGFREKWYYNYI